LVSLFGFDNAKRLFPAVHPDTPFSLVTLGDNPAEVELTHYILTIDVLQDPRRHFSLGPEGFQTINPNTLTCPIFRSRMDAELTRKIYQRVPVMIREARCNGPEQNPWGISFRQGLFNMTSDSNLFKDSSAPERLPLYEAKMIHQFDHRWASYRVEDRKDMSGDVAMADKQNPDFYVTPRY